MSFLPSSSLETINTRIEAPTKNILGYRAMPGPIVVAFVWRIGMRAVNATFGRSAGGLVALTTL